MTKDQKASLKHALMHLESNRIYLDNPEYFTGSWYCGNKEIFIKRHIKAMKLIRELLEPTCIKEYLSERKSKKKS